MKKTLLYIICATFLASLPSEIAAQLQVSSETMALSSTETDDQRSRRTRDREEDQENFADKLVFGGNIGFGFGDFAFVNVTPQIGYRVSDNLSIGTGLEWFYQSGGGIFVNRRTIGPMLWAQFIPTQDIFLTSNYVYSFQKVGELTDTANQLWIGGGYLQRFGGGAMRIGGEYNVFGNQGIFNNPNFGSNRFRPQISFIYGI